MTDEVVMCACGCGKTLKEAIRDARNNPGWLSPDQAESQVLEAHRMHKERKEQS